MKQTYTYKKNLRYRYYTCYNHLKIKSCSAPRSSFPAEPIEQQLQNQKAYHGRLDAKKRFDPEDSYEQDPTIVESTPKA